MPRPVKHRIVSVNLFVGNRRPWRGVMAVIARCLLRLGGRPDAICVQEGHGRLVRGALGRVPGYRLVVARDQGEAGLDVPVLLRRRGIRYTGHSFDLREHGTGSGVFDHPRGDLVVTYRKRGVDVAVINAHMGVFGEDRAVEGHVGPAAEAHRDHARALDAKRAILGRLGFTVFVCSDANSRGAWDGSLPAVLRRSGQFLSRRGVDLVALDPERAGFEELVTVDKAVTGSDHHDALCLRAVQLR